MSTSTPHKISFELIVESGRDWLEWIDAASKFETVVKSNIDWSSLKGEESQFVGRRLKTTPPPKQILLNAVYITMVAGFEEYLRASLKSIAAHLTGQKKAYAEFQKDLIRTNIREAARLLKRMDSPPDYLQFNEDDLCQVLGSCTPGSNAVIFNGEALSEVEGLIRLKNFCDRAAALGKKIDLDQFGKDSKIKEALGQKSSSSTREVRKLLEAELTKIATFRNRVAHQGGSASDVTDSILFAHRGLLCAVADAVEIGLK